MASNTILQHPRSHKRLLFYFKKVDKIFGNLIRALYLYYMKQAQTLREVLATEEGRRMVNAIEDIESSLDSYGGYERTLIEIINIQIEELRLATGFEWPRKYAKK